MTGLGDGTLSLSIRTHPLPPVAPSRLGRGRRARPGTDRPRSTDGAHRDPENVGKAGNESKWTGNELSPLPTSDTKRLVFSFFP